MHGFDRMYLEGRWSAIMRDYCVRVLRRKPTEYSAEAYGNQQLIERALYYGNLGQVFDFIEFVLRHPKAEMGLRTELAQAFVDARAAYRVVSGNTIMPVGTGEQAAAIQKALADSAQSAGGASAHLLAAGTALRSGDWAGSVRESIHAVESIAVQLAPSEGTLGAALKALGRSKHLPASLSGAFSKLYGYACDEEGVRHALVFQGEAQVDEADALFMLGACASFVSYLTLRGREADLIPSAPGPRNDS